MFSLPFYFKTDTSVPMNIPQNGAFQNESDSNEKATVALRCIVNKKLYRSKRKSCIKSVDFNSTCATTSHNERKILKHFLLKHKYVDLIYVQNETIDNTFLRSSLVSCHFRCNICKKQCKNIRHVQCHYRNEHPYDCIDAEIFKRIEVIQSKSEHPVNSVRIESTQFHLRRLFYCVHHKRSLLLGHRNDAIAHYNQKHKRKGRFEVYSKFLLQKDIPEVKFKTQNIHGAYLLECRQCHSLFETVDEFFAHSIGTKRDHTQFIAKRLFACYYCRRTKIMGTLQGMLKHHKTKHSQKYFRLASTINVQWCGCCDKSYKNNDNFYAHFAEKHSSTDILTDDFLHSMSLSDVNYDLCKFSPGCCAQMIFDGIFGILQHIAESKRRLICIECGIGVFFLNIIDYTLHCNLHHKENTSEIIEKLHDINRFLSITADMLIYFPCGLVTTLKAIKDTKIGKILNQSIAYHIHGDIWPNECRILNGSIQKIFSSFPVEN